MARGFAAAPVAAALDELDARNLLSDRRFTECFVAERAGRGQGPLKIRHELRSRGVSDALAAEFLDVDARAWRRAAHEARRKRFGDAAPADAGERARQMRFLHQRGFEAEQIRHAFRADQAGDDEWT